MVDSINQLGNAHKPALELPGIRHSCRFKTHSDEINANFESAATPYKKPVGSPELSSIQRFHPSEQET
jgi:hypothetical protein